MTLGFASAIRRFVRAMPPIDTERHALRLLLKKRYTRDGVQEQVRTKHVER
jgi:hypothetical protein